MKDLPIVEHTEPCPSSEDLSKLEDENRQLQREVNYLKRITASEREIMPMLMLLSKHSDNIDSTVLNYLKYV